MKPIGEYIDELRTLDQHNIGSWPNWAYGLAMSVVSLVIMLIAAWYFVLPKRDALHAAQRTEIELKQRYRIKHSMVANLAAYREQLSAMQSEFGYLLAQLPSKTEVPDLLRDISQSRSANGLDGQLFKPEPESRQDFYAVLPNDLVVTGNFNQFGRFVSEVAALPRIVTIGDIRIEPVENDNAAPDRTDTGPLRMRLTASTYRYLEAEDKNANDTTSEASDS